MKILETIGIIALFLVISSCNGQVTCDSSYTEYDTLRIIQECLDISELQEYYHVEDNPTRKSLCILINSHLFKEYEIYKFGNKVSFINDRVLNGSQANYLEFTKFDLYIDCANITLRYIPEGIELKIVLTKLEKNWQVSQYELVEY